MTLTTETASILFLLLVAAGVVAYWHRSITTHDERLEQLDVRVHVNGIRGKSSVTRLVAGVLREGGFVTVAKTTGSAARVIDPHGRETPIHRRGAATINEQVEVVGRHVTPDVEALVIECMAVRPLYQEFSQERMVRSDITIITNVREDHQEEMGETLEEIADSMSVTIPEGGVLVTAEHRPDLVERLRRNAAARDSRLVVADPGQVLDEDLQRFDYVQFRDNVAIGLEVARLLDIDRDAALRGMVRAAPDIGVVRLRAYDVRGKRVLWVPLFAANDRESVVLNLELLAASHFPEGAPVIGILNNRQDRGRRAELFAELVPTDLASFLDHVVTFGAYERTVTDTILARGFPAERVHNLGETVAPSLDEILDTIAALLPGDEGVLVGLVNIHTEQAELLLDHFARSRGESVAGHGDDSDLTELPGSVQRARRVASRYVLRHGDDDA